MILITFDMDSDDNVTKKDTTDALNTLHNNHPDESSSSFSSQQVGGIRNRKD